MAVLNYLRTALIHHKHTLMMEVLKGHGLRYASLLHQEAYIGGKWVSAASGKLFPVTNPANSKVIASVPDMEVTDTEAAINSAYEAFQTWQTTTARGEVAQSPASSKELFFLRQPIGVASMITPWNFPNAMITRKAGAALAAGCTCVIKPAEDTPLSALAAVDLAEKAGFPPGVINVVTTSRANTPAVGKLMCTSPKVAGISFTGSTAIGRVLYEQCASGIKRIGLELGGNAPFIVFSSADVKSAVEGLMVAKFRNSGQACISANRILVQEEIYDKFSEALEEAVRKRLTVGDGFNKEVNIGPLININQLKRVERIVNESVAAGAGVVLGGKCHDMGDLFFQPTILCNVTEDMACFQEEIFGPVIALKKFKCEEEAVNIANASKFGLACYFYSQDVSQVWRVARRLESGMIGINEGLISTAEGAFGGVKQSGIGREGSRHGIDDYTYLKYICLGGIN
ncbi:succinate-semialdehyde dehydrogenase, mitochondrial-like isoform X3 [Homarus americanus]|uniref:succinate-semialdehyde dehydrogenase, mitochondrial-like isoform X3 n=1 Tax=Homarus americanus TaxID=6706 RepID=UPI001C48C7B4|nr:succinate-semialdehyde dehydrogenase, mitochondrial-like isoform X3 [Homarus americanus]